MMRIGIDARYLSHGLVGGVHGYVLQMVQNLCEVGAEECFFIYADDKRPFELPHLPNNATVRILPYRNALSSIQHDWFMHRTMAADQLDVVHFPTNYGFAPKGVKSVITLHDQINIMPLREIIRGHPKQLKAMVMMSYLHLCSTRAVRQADVIVTVSGYSKRQILAQAPDIPADKIVPIFFAPPAHIQRISDTARLDAACARLGVTKPYVLADGIKNPATLTRAWQLLPQSVRDQYQIVFFSRRTEPSEPINEAVARGDALLLVRPSDEDLLALYNRAAAFVFPSWIEGFGLPLVEAMICGAPVIASDRGSIPEVVGDAALLADAEDAATFAQHIELVLTNPAQAADLRAKGFARAAFFSWKQTARDLLALYQKISPHP